MREDQFGHGETRGEESELVSDPGLAEEEARARLLNALPAELQERYRESSPRDIERVLAERERLGYKRITGYHVSDKDLPVGAYLDVSPEEGGVWYTDNPKNLLGRHGGGFVYLIDGTTSDHIIDPQLSWRITKGKTRIIGKMTVEEAAEKLGATFAPVEYH